jgi:hypothetical protein
MRRGIIGPDFEQRTQELSLELNQKITTLRSSESMEEKRELAIVVSNLRDELFQWNQRLNGPLSNTCEQIADSARLEFLTSCIVRDALDKKVWDSHDAYMREKNQSLALKARFEVMLYLQGVESDFLDTTPEAVAMKEVREDALDKAKKAMDDIRIAAEKIEAEEAIIAESAMVEEDTSKAKVSKKKIAKK